jgi:hypothetical protein
MLSARKSGQVPPLSTAMQLSATILPERRYCTVELRVQKSLAPATSSDSSIIIVITVSREVPRCARPGNVGSRMGTDRHWG